MMLMLHPFLAIVSASSIFDWWMSFEAFDRDEDFLASWSESEAAVEQKLDSSFSFVSGLFHCLSTSGG